MGDTAELQALLQCRREERRKEIDEKTAALASLEAKLSGMQGELSSVEEELRRLDHASVLSMNFEQDFAAVKSAVKLLTLSYYDGVVNIDDERCKA